MKERPNLPIQIEKLEKQDRILEKHLSKVKVLKKKYYSILRGATIGGDAPKEVVRIYEYQKGVRKIDQEKKWNKYVVKTGHKWYPTETITEYLINRIGCKLGLKMADAKIFIINKQLRFASKFFLGTNRQTLEHGAEIYSGYLANDKDFVEEIENENLSRELFTLSFTKKALEYNYGLHHEEIFYDFVKMLVFDAIVGNNDRHFYNWGVITDVRNKERPIFSPIYDSARGLFWNKTDQKLKHYLHDEQPLINYAKKSRPKTGLELRKIKNHLDLIHDLKKNRLCDSRRICDCLISENSLKKCIDCIEKEFEYLLSETRKKILCRYFTIRFEHLFDALR